MKLLFIVDGRSPIALNWVRYFAEGEDEVHLVSMYPCAPDFPLASLTVLPVAFSGAVEAGGGGTHPGLKSRLLRAAATPAVRTWLRHHFVPRSLPKAADRLRARIAEIRPDVVHAMRVPYEGMLAALAYDPPPKPRPPLLVSIWGNDFTLHAPATRTLTRLTRLTLQRADALHTDCYRDQRLAREWGFDPGKPAVVLPGGGGIQMDVFKPPEPSETESAAAPVVINPRGLRAYVRSDTFFRAIPLVRAAHPGVRFVCPNMAGQPEAERWVRELHLGEAVELLPRQSRAQMAALFRRAQVVVSPSTHDGTPNTLLEAMACGCFPVVGDIEPLREWISPGENGFLVDPADPQALADAICEGLQRPELRARAREHNLALIRERAEYPAVMAAAKNFYRRLPSGGNEHE